MSADRLREAAKVLRERAQAATSGPWAIVSGASNVWHFPDEGGPTLIVAGTGAARIQRRSTEARLSDAAYIATMHPGVGIALADWLDLIATSWSDPHADSHTDLDGWHIEFEESTDTHGLKIADLILGVEATR